MRICMAYNGFNLRDTFGIAHRLFRASAQIELCAAYDSCKEI